MYHSTKSRRHSACAIDLNYVGLFFLIMLILLVSPGPGEAAGGETVSADSAAGGSAILTWDAPTTNTDKTPLTDLAGYKIYYWSSSDDWPNSRRKGKLRVVPLIILVKLTDNRLTCKKIETKNAKTDKTECTFIVRDSMIQGFKQGKEYSFAVTAYNKSETESNHSNAVMKKIE